MIRAFIFARLSRRDSVSPDDRLSPPANVRCLSRRCSRKRHPFWQVFLSRLWALTISFCSCVWSSRIYLPASLRSSEVWFLSVIITLEALYRQLSAFVYGCSPPCSPENAVTIDYRDVTISLIGTCARLSIAFTGAPAERAKRFGILLGKPAFRKPRRLPLRRFPFKSTDHLW